VDPLISAGTLLEASIVLQSKLGAIGLADLDELLATAGVRCIAVDLAQAHAARDAFARFGKGRDRAGLSYGDCFAYALAKVAQTPLLFKGEDFRQTDLVAAVIA
jgi:ribonuclease VapC